MTLQFRFIIYAHCSLESFVNTSSERRDYWKSGANGWPARANTSHTPYAYKWIANDLRLLYLCLTTIFTICKQSPFSFSVDIVTASAAFGTFDRINIIFNFSMKSFYSRASISISANLFQKLMYLRWGLYFYSDVLSFAQGSTLFKTRNTRISIHIVICSFGMWQDVNRGWYRDRNIDYFAMISTMI